MDLVYFKKFGFYIAYDDYNNELVKILPPDWDQEGGEGSPLVSRLADYIVSDYFYHRILSLDEARKQK